MPPKTTGSVPLLAACSAFAIAILPASAFAASTPDGALALKRVLLSTGGVGYFEHEATVTGDTVLSLPVRRDQVDDVLKSIVVYDDHGGVGAISLPGEEPLEAVFRELPFGPEALDSPIALLGALKGAEIRVTGSRALDGRLLSVTPETTQARDGGTLTRHRIAVMTATGLQHLIWEEVENLTLADAARQAQVDQALAALARHGERQRRTLAIRANGQGTRTVRVAYVAEAPLWKATYRLTLPATGAAAGDLQGWAVLENLSGEDWSGVELTVASGNPVTFRQALYSAYYVNRPEVPVEVLGRILPKADAGAMAADSESGFAGAPKTRAMTSPAPMVPPPIAGAAPPAPAMAAPMRNETPQAAQLAAADSSEATSQVLFRYPQPVTVANGDSLMLPIVARSVPATRVDLFQPATHPRNPLDSVRLDNGGDGAVGLPPGVLTLYERAGDGAGVSYVGDARMNAVPAGEQRLLSFALDQKLRVERDERPSQRLSAVTAADGILSLTVTERQTTTYTIAGPAAGATAEPRTVIIEHPRRNGWSLVEPTGGEPAGITPDITPDAYRLPVTVPAGGTAKLAVTLERPRVERVALTDLSVEQIGTQVTGRDLPPELRDSLQKLAGMRATLAGHQQRVAVLEKERGEIIGEQTRLRDNLAALPKDSDLHKRTLAKMGEQESRLDALAKELAAARRDMDGAQRALADLARAIKV